MSFSAQHRTQEINASHTNCPSSRDLHKPSGEGYLSKNHTTEPEDNSLVEHILDFLDKYPARFAPRVPPTGCVRIC